ncbi:polyprenyl synthetase family protein [Leucobacter luti]|uniref:Octaprenyl-diphosphate synthase n=1 Tax=Leucobacter luti TaxID=340320 RepID=A0A4Q7TUB2_9MICO|nr:polyprenyl synthetase family protein [Leucobacter luti]RZT64541.1 octaprenyl-diphosphate synthase [Leucobacter luti]
MDAHRTPDSDCAEGGAAHVSRIHAATADYLRELTVHRFASTPLPRQHPEVIAALAGGKHLRARAFIATALAYGARDERLLREVAAAIELIHTASLVHDDILDDSSLRRGVPALHAATSTGTAVLVGDSLVALAFEAAVGRAGEVTAALARAFGELCLGQLSEPELGWANDALPALERYGALKTGALFGAALECGGIVAGRPPAECAMLRTAGVRLGLAFQLEDDLLDVQGDAAALGKDHGADLRNGIPTYPLWLAYRALTADRAGEVAITPGELAATANSAWIADRTAQRVATLVSEARATVPQPAHARLLEIAIQTVVPATVPPTPHPTETLPDGSETP